MSDISLLIIRVVLGMFFILARFRFFYDPNKEQGFRYMNLNRIASLTAKMTSCGIKNNPYEWAYFIALAEVLAGVSLVIGLLTELSALGLLIILLYATKCTCKDKILKQNPVDKLDYACCYLWTAEPLYILLCLLIVLNGAGTYSLDSLLW